MGCSSSKPEQNTGEHENFPKRQPIESGNVAPLESVVKKQDQPDRAMTKDDGNANPDLPQVSLELLIAKKEQPRRTSLGKDNPKKVPKKSKELKQVVAWGKKTTTTENNFLEDLRLLRETAGKTNHYEKDYEETEVDETSRYIEGMDSEDSTGSFHSAISNKLEHPTGLSRSGEQEESFDASKIIDVEKFRAANAIEKKQTSDSNEDMNRNNKHCIQTKSSHENHILYSSLQDITATKKESLSGLYNEDDEDLIESIEKEYLITRNNYLPGQIIN